MRSQENISFLQDLQNSHRLGRYKPIPGTKRLIGPDWRILTASFSLIFFPGLWCYFTLIFVKEGFLLNLIYAVLFGGALFIDLYTLVDSGTTEPGIIPKSSSQGVNKKYKFYIDPLRYGHGLIECKPCRTCNIIRPPRSFHCKKCDACIEVHDHHCPWTGTCVGRRAHKKFILFLMSTFQL